jgi:hypothetical protein
MGPAGILNFHEFAPLMIVIKNLLIMTVWLDLVPQKNPLGFDSILQANATDKPSEPLPS